MVISLLSIGLSLANDSTSHPTPTGIEFIKNDDVSIESETLTLHERSVEVVYDFYNHSAKKLSVQMAFPLSEFDLVHDRAEDPSAWNFLVFVNGRPYKDIRVQWRALVNGTDKALILQKAGINIGSPVLKVVTHRDRNWSITNYTCLNYDLNKEEQALLIKEGLAYKNSELETCLTPAWTAQAIYLWKAKFPPKQITKVKHMYNQLPGSWSCNPEEENSVNFPCRNLEGAIQKFGRIPMDTFFYEYVIHTGGNWKGPIKKFHFKAEAPSGSWASVKAPFAVKRESDNILTADLDNYKPLSITEIKKQMRTKSLREADDSVIWFNYAKRQKSVIE